MNNSALQKGLIINGTDSIAVARMEDAVYRLQPIPEMTQVMFEDFINDRPKVFNLSTELPHDYQVVGMVVDFTEDDYQSLGTGSSNQTTLSCRVEIRVFRNGKAVQSFYTTIGAYPAQPVSMLLQRGDTWEIKCHRTINKLTFDCVPVLINKPITLSGSVPVITFGGSTNN